MFMMYVLFDSFSNFKGLVFLARLDRR